MSDRAEFEAARSRVENLTTKPSNEELLKLYGLYKQVTEGDNTQEAPTGFDFKGIAKHNAWLDQSGKSEEANG